MQLQTLSFTTTGAGTSPYLTANVNNTGYYATFQTIVTGTATYSIEINLGQQVVSTTQYKGSPIEPDPAGWFTPYTALTTQTGAAFQQGLYPCYFIRIRVASTTGAATVKLKYVQQGVV